MKDVIESVGMLIGVILLFCLIMLGINSCSREQWNEGICPSCEVRYELRGVSRGLKYYICPQCGDEVKRF